MVNPTYQKNIHRNQNIPKKSKKHAGRNKKHTNNTGRDKKHTSRNTPEHSDRKGSIPEAYREEEETCDQSDQLPEQEASNGIEEDKAYHKAPNLHFGRNGGIVPSISMTFQVNCPPPLKLSFTTPCASSLES